MHGDGRRILRVELVLLFSHKIVRGVKKREIQVGEAYILWKNGRGILMGLLDPSVVESVPQCIHSNNILFVCRQMQ